MSFAAVLPVLMLVLQQQASLPTSPIKRIEVLPATRTIVAGDSVHLELRALDAEQYAEPGAAARINRRISRVAGGGVVAKSLPSPEHRETAVAGSIRIYVPIEFFVKRFHDIVGFKRSEMVLQIGRFSNPPTLADVAGLTFDPSDLDALRRCRVGNCSWKLSAATIERFRTAVDWNAPNWRDQATVIGRRLLVENTDAYLERGDDAIAPVADRRKPVDSSEEFHALLGNLGVRSRCGARLLPVPRRVSTEQARGRGRLRLLVKGNLRHEVGHQPDARRHAADSADGPMVIVTKGLLSEPLPRRVARIDAVVSSRDRRVASRERRLREPFAG